MWAAAGLLLLEALALALLVADRVEASGAVDLLSSPEAADITAELLPALQALTATGDGLVAAIGLLPVVIMAALGAPLMFLRRRAGWLLGMLAQALLLATCLARYIAGAADSPSFIYPLLAYGVLCVLYLNARHVRAAVYDRPSHPARLDDGRPTAVQEEGPRA